MFTAFVDHAEIPARLGFFVRNDPVRFAEFDAVFGIHDRLRSTKRKREFSPPTMLRASSAGNPAGRFNIRYSV